MNSPLTIRLEREGTERPWGFRLQGSIDTMAFLFSFH